MMAWPESKSGGTARIAGHPAAKTLAQRPKQAHASQTMRKLLWTLTIIGALLGAMFVVAGLFGESRGPEQGVMATIGIACAVIPYCIARATSEFKNTNYERD
jgi:magnesium-transporting ATPase (P-type)